MERAGGVLCQEARRIARHISRNKIHEIKTVKLHVVRNKGALLVVSNSNDCQRYDAICFKIFLKFKSLIIKITDINTKNYTLT